MTGDVLPFPKGELRRVATKSLLRRAEAGESIGKASATEIGRLLGRSARTVYRDVQRGGYNPKPRKRFRVEDEELTALFAYRGARSLAHEWLTEHFWPAGEGPSYAQFCRACGVDVHPYLWSAMVEGDRDARQHELMLILTYDRPYELLSIDGKQMSIFIQHSTKRDPDDPSKALLVQPWVLWAKDAKTHGITGAVMSEDALTHRDLLRVLQQSFRGEPELGPFAGRAEAVGWDRATINTADVVTKAMCALVIPAHISDAYQPHQNGLIESFNALAESRFAAADPFYAHPPIQLDGRSFMPDPEHATTLDQFSHKLRNWVAAYNANWRHSQLDHQTPTEAWEASETKPGPIPEEWLRFLHLDSRTGTVVPGGVRVDNEFFTDPCLDPLIHREVDIRYSDDRRTVEVFDVENGDWLCTAINQKLLTAKEKLAIKAPAKARRGQVRKLRHTVLSRQEGDAAQTRRTPVPLTEAEADAEDAVAATVGKARLPRGDINQPVQLPTFPERRRGTL